MGNAKLPRLLVSLRPGDKAPSLDLPGDKTDSYSLLRGPGVYLVVRSGSVITTSSAAPEAGPVLDVSGEVIDPGVEDLYSRVDATLLRAGASKEELRLFAEKAKEKKCRNVCVFPAHMRYVADIWPAPATVVSFPHGLDTAKMKAAEIKKAIREGAGEIDMVANRTLIHARDWDLLDEEVQRALDACSGKSLKVILETGELSAEETALASRCLDRAGADCIKTSTGTTPVGATVEAVEIIREAAPKRKIKASGGIRTREAAAALLGAGADIFGISNLDAFA